MGATISMGGRMGFTSPTGSGVGNSGTRRPPFWLIGDQEVEPHKEEHPTRLSRVQMHCLSDVLKITMVSEYCKGMSGPF